MFLFLQVNLRKMFSHCNLHAILVQETYMQTYVYYVDKENQHCIFNIELIHLLPFLGSLPSCRERKKHLAAISKQVTFPEVLFLSSLAHLFKIYIILRNIYLI